MSDEARIWVQYAEENLATSRLALEHDYLNASLQNAQQASEKAMKALVLQYGLEFRKTHSITELRALLATGGVLLTVQDDDCDLLDSIYMPSKYPAVSVLPDSAPDKKTCNRCLVIAENIVSEAKHRIQ